jgi:hypothetical protein
MSVSRRIFLKAGVSTGISALVILQTVRAANLLGVGDNDRRAGGPGFNIPPESDLDAINSLSLETFSSLKNTGFGLYDGALKVARVELIQATALKSRPRLEAFSLVFKGPAGRPLDQNTYRVRHDGLKPFNLLIVPFKRDDSGVYYEAIFNRLRK